MPDALLVLHIDIEIADQDNASVRANALAATGKLAALHIALHDVDPV
jgi:hypothetical protein